VTPNFLAVRANAWLNLSGYGVTVDGLAGEGIVDSELYGSSLFGSAPCTLTISNNTANQAFAGTLQNSYAGLSLIKAGSATQTLSGVNVYTGATTVAQGTLMVNGTLGFTPVSVASGAKLAAPAGSTGR